MISLLLVCAAMVAGPVDSTVSTEGLKAYQEAKSRSPRDADAQVRLALWCESHGMQAERTEHLAKAVLLDANHAAARGLLGQVFRDGRWQSPEVAVEKARTDAKLAATLSDYNARRARTGPTQQAQWDLALWCESAGLTDEATAHFSAVTRLELTAGNHKTVDHRQAAWKKLGCKLSNGRWLNDAQIAAEKSDAKARDKANHRWSGLLARWRKETENRLLVDEAERKLAAITDPLAVPAVWAIFGSQSGSDQSRAVQILGQIDAPASSRALASLAVWSTTDNARRSATETLMRRDRREYLESLLSLIQTPLKYELRPPANAASVGELFVEGERYNVKRLYDVVGNFTPGPNFHGRIWIAEDGLPSAVGGKFLTAYRNSPTPEHAQDIADEVAKNRAKLFMSLGEAYTVASQRLANDVQAIDSYNTQAHSLNTRRVLPVVSAVTGQDLGESSEAWTKWWVDQIGYRYVSPPSKPTFLDNQTTLAPPVPIYSCFGAGTPVGTLSGLVSIEKIEVGDRVLSRDTRTGSLSYQPVLAIHHNPPDVLLKLCIGEDSILSTGYHRFWKAGHGWVMARDLKPGDSIRTMSGVARLQSVSTSPQQPVFNLDVARTHSFFVGRQGELVHDNSLPEPELEPFDAVVEGNEREGR
ncbi:MAG: hypothetical protein JWN86_3538 [Planctomycetota bacterium]|nr:hypothetical protein [Planctomycetota bacterium]